MAKKTDKPAVKPAATLSLADLFSNPQIVALSKTVKENTLKEARPGVEPGSYPMDITITINGNTVHLDGFLNVAEDGEQRPTSNFMSMEFIALLLQRCGFQRELILSKIREVAPEYIANGQKVGDALKPLLKDLEGFKAEYGKLMDGLPKVRKSGNCTLQVTVEKVDQVSEDSADADDEKKIA